MTTFLYKILLTLWAILLIVFSFYTPDWLHLNPDLPYPDKYKHVVGAFVLAWLFHKAFPRVNLWLALLAWLVFNTGFEVVQQLVTHGQRQFDWLDVGANVTGFIMGIFVILIAGVGKIRLARN